MRVHGFRGASALLLAAIAIIASACGEYAPALRFNSADGASWYASANQVFDDAEGPGHWQHNL
jgi:hypothetical protein